MTKFSKAHSNEITVFQCLLNKLMLKNKIFVYFSSKVISLYSNLAHPPYQTLRHVTYDYIVIGCGSAGCVLTNRLSENERENVLAIEAGPEDSWWDARIHMPAAIPSNLQSNTYNWSYHTTPQKNLNNR